MGTAPIQRGFRQAALAWTISWAAASTPDRLYLSKARPGTGKTTLALQFLLEGVDMASERLYISLSENRRELRSVARRHGWSLDGIDIFELVPPEDHVGSLDRELTVLHPAEMELNETDPARLRTSRETNPARVVFDSLSEMRLLAQSPLRYRRQILALKHFFAGRRCTVVAARRPLLRARTTFSCIQSRTASCSWNSWRIDYGAERRRLRVVKMRGISFRGGYHDFKIEHGGLAIFPRLIAAEHHKDVHRRVHAQRERRTRRPAGRRPRARHQRPADRQRGRRQVLPCAHLRGRGGRARRAGRPIRVR